MEKRENHYDEPLVKPPKPRKQGCCAAFFSCLCCCFIKKVISTQTNRKLLWKERWGKIRDKLSKKKHFDHVYKILLELYSHNDAVAELEQCKISPKSKDVIRDDLEFYIPQLW